VQEFPKPCVAGSIPAGGTLSAVLRVMLDVPASPGPASVVPIGRLAYRWPAPSLQDALLAGEASHGLRFGLYPLVPTP
jgi:hypothetical protein